MSEPKVEYNSGGKGRPRKPESEKRSTALKCYVTQSEKDEIEDNAALAGMSVSDFLRDLGMGHELDHTANSEELQKVRYLLGKIGGHTNQIAKAVNQGKIDRLDESRVEMEVTRDGETTTEEMNFRELMIYLHNKLEELL
jgi:hypothetical protein